MTTDSTSTRPPEAAHTPLAQPHTPESAAAQHDAAIIGQPGGLRSNTLGPWEVFAQGLAAAAPSVAVASVPFALYTAAGKGAAWAAIIGLVIAVLLATPSVFKRGGRSRPARWEPTPVTDSDPRSRSSEVSVC